MKFTFIIPVYNAEKYLEECIHSVLNQTYSNYEVLLVNDGSTDNSLNIIKNFALKDKRVKVLNKKNGGVSSARNYALNSITGDYILFVDADDICNDKMLEIVEKNIKNFDMLMFAYERKYKNKVLPIRKNEKGMINKNIAEEIFSKSEYSGYLWNKVFYSKIIKSKNIRFNEKLHFCEDMVFISDYLKYVSSVKYVDKILYSYRMRVSSVSNVLINKKNMSILESYKYLFASYESSNLLKNKFMYNYVECFMKFKKVMSEEDINEYYTPEIDSFIKKISIKKRIKLIIINKFYVCYILFRKLKNSIISYYE